MQFDPTLLLAQIQQIAAQFGPWGVLVAAAIAVYLRLRKPSSPANPADPVPASSAPLRDAALKILARIAARKYPSLSKEEAVERYVVEQASTAYYLDDRARE